MASTPPIDMPGSARTDEPVSVEELVEVIHEGSIEQQGIGAMLYDLYTAMDRNKDGKLTPADAPGNDDFAILDFSIDGFDKGLRASIHAMVRHFDADRSGRLGEAELNAIMRHVQAIRLETVDAMDPASGTITTDSLVQAMDSAVNHGLPTMRPGDTPQR